MGELALRYPPRSLIVSTGRHSGSDASDPRFPHPIDHVGIRATRLRTLNGLALWTARADTLVRRHRPGFVWCAELKPAGYPARWLRARYRLPYGVLVHGTELLLLQAKMRRSRFKWWTARQLLGGASVVVANSRWTADLARSVLGALGRPALTPEVRVVPLGTTPSHFRPGIDPRPVRAKYGLDGGPWLLTVSRLDTHKGIDTVIRALPAVRAAFPAARYAVAGVGSRGPEFARLAAALGLADAVKFLGFVADAELPAVYNAADLYVGASRRYDLLAEGFGIALVEASACGLAVVAETQGGSQTPCATGKPGSSSIPTIPQRSRRASRGCSRTTPRAVAWARRAAARSRPATTGPAWPRTSSGSPASFGGGRPRARAARVRGTRP